MNYPAPLLDDVFKLLKRMTQSDDRASHVPQPSRWNRRMGRGLIVLSVVGTIAIAIASVMRQLWATAVPAELQYALAFTAVLPGLAFLVLTLCNLLLMVYQQWRDPWATIYRQLHSDLQADAPHVTELKRFPKEVLKYALLQYRHRWGRIEGRAVLLAGDIRKLGLFPGFLAIFVAVPKLLDGAGRLWLWQAIALLGAFHLMAFLVAATSERRSQVIDLLQHAIDHADSAPPEIGDPDGANGEGATGRR